MTDWELQLIGHFFNKGHSLEELANLSMTDRLFLLAYSEYEEEIMQKAVKNNG